MKVQTTFRMIHFPKLDRWVGMAWNYDHAIMIATPPRSTYTAARESLGKLAAVSNTELRFFDGEFTLDTKTEQIVPMSCDWQVGQLVRSHSGHICGEVKMRFLENGERFLRVLDGSGAMVTVRAAEVRRYQH